MTSRPPSDLDMRLLRALEKSYLRAEFSLAQFVRRAWRILEPDKPLKWNWHLDLLCEYLEAVEAGRIKRLVINVPPRSLKSIIVTVCYPCWAWVRRPGKRFLFSSYASSLSIKHSVDRRQVIESDWFQYGWGTRFRLSDDQNSKAEFANTRRGHMIATSMEGTATGKGCDVLIIDDPQNPKEAYSDPERESANDNFDRTFTSRLDDKKEGAIVIVMQRLHPRDLTGHVVANAPQDWLVLSLPAEAQDDECHVYPMTGRIHRRAKGELLHDDREGRAELDKQKRAMGSAQFSAQYNQNPTNPEGAIIKRAWLRFYRQLPSRMQVMLQSWDMTFKETKSGSFVCGQVWGRNQALCYLIDQTRARVDFVGACTMVRTMHGKWPAARTKLIENKANGPAVISQLKNIVPGLVECEVKGGSKEARLHAVSPLFEAGNVELPDPTIAPWIHDWLEEVCSYSGPGTTPNDDQVDACSQALDNLQYRGPLHAPGVVVGSY